MALSPPPRNQAQAASMAVKYMSACLIVSCLIQVNILPLFRSLVLEPKRLTYLVSRFLYGGGVIRVLMNTYTLRRFARNKLAALQYDFQGMDTYIRFRQTRASCTSIFGVMV